MSEGNGKATLGRGPKPCLPEWARLGKSIRYPCPKCGTNILAAEQLIDAKGILSSGTICPSRYCDWRGVPVFEGLKKK